MARLDEVTPIATTRRWPWVAGLATAAAVLIVVGEFRRVEVPEFRRVEGPEFRSAEVPEFRSAEVPQIPSSAVPQPPASAPIRLPAYRTISESELEWMSRRVRPLDVFDPIQPAPMSITPLTMTPLMALPASGDTDEGRS